jgi:hypothetical protein
MKTLKQFITFLITALATYMGYEQAGDMVTNFAVMIAAVYALTELLKGAVSNNNLVQVFSWAVGILLSALGYWLELGMFAEFNLVFSLITGLGVSLVTNGIYDAEFIQGFWNFLKGLFKTD